MTLRQTLPMPAAALAALLATVLLAGTVLAGQPTVVVQPGDTLSELSAEHGVSIDTLVALNTIVDPNLIYVGQHLKLASEPAAAPAAPAAAAPAIRTHVVQRGEHLIGIARTYGTTVAVIVAANGIANPSRIFVGDSLTIPGAPEAPAAPAAPAVALPASRTHVVQWGEHLTGIARLYGTTVAAIVAANGIANPSRIFAGQRLSIPGATIAAAAAPTAAVAVPPSMATVMAARDGVRQVIVDEAARYAVPANFALAVAWQESGWQQGAVSSAGAIGVMQLLPSTAEWVGDAMLGAPVNPYDLRSNVRAGVCLLAHYLARYGGDRALALAAYYQGQAATDAHGIYAVSRPYIGSILSIERQLGG